MFVAELKGKLPGDVQRMEDILTSYFFGVMKNLPSETFLLPWLRVAGLGFEQIKDDSPAFSFWESLPDGTEPDLIVRTRNDLIMIEVKYLSALGADKSQLEREVTEGLAVSRAEGLAFSFIALTNDFQEPSAVKGLRAEYPPEELGYECIWTSWRKAFGVVESALKKDTPHIQILNDLLKVMEKRGLRGFRGFSHLEGKMMKCKEAIGLLDEMSRNISVMFKELDPLLDKLGFTCFKPLANTVIRDGAYRNLNEPQTWVPTYFARAYIKSLGETDPEDALYFVKVQLDEDNPVLVIGGSISVERENLKLFEHTEVNRFFLDMRDFPLEPFDELQIENMENLPFYLLGGRLLLLAEKSLSEVKTLESLEPVAAWFPEIRRILKIANQYLSTRVSDDDL